MSTGAINLSAKRSPIQRGGPVLSTAADDATARNTAELDLLANLMDSVFQIPGVPIRFGLDALLGLIPGVGDAAGSVVLLYILHKAHRLGLPRATLLRMALNVGIDTVVGAIPFAGDAFDVYWKANRRNVELVRRHALAPPTDAKSLRRSDAVFVGVAIVAIAGLIVASAAATIYTAAWLWGVVSHAFA